MKLARFLALPCFLACLAGCAPAAPDNTAPGTALAPGSLRSGYDFLQAETRALQDDDFSNPGFLWVDRGAALFHAAPGTDPDVTDAPACASCHQTGSRPLQGIAATYPQVDARTGALLNLEARINLCRTTHQAQDPLVYESSDLLALTAYVASLSRGEAVRVDITGPAAGYYEQGRNYFFARRGQFDLACSQCHNDNWGRKLRGETISQGHGNAFPAYRLEWQDFGSLHRRLRDCDAGVRAEPYPYGSDIYMALELYLASRADGLVMEAPGVRR